MIAGIYPDFEYFQTVKTLFVSLFATLFLVLAGCSDPAPETPEYVRRVNRSVSRHLTEFYSLDTSEFRLVNLGLYNLPYDSTLEAQNLLDTISAYKKRLQNPIRTIKDENMILDVVANEDSFLLIFTQEQYASSKNSFHPPVFYAAEYDIKLSPENHVFLLDTATFEIHYIKSCPSCPYAYKP